MKTLVVGGTGGIGGYIALELQRQGHEVVLAARKPALPQTPVAKMPIILGSYVDGDFTRAQLEGFDNLIFSACNDIRQLPPNSTPAQEAAFYQKANSKAVPRFVALAKAAGIRRTAYIGSFYPQAKPELLANSSYIRSRRDADEGARALADASFRVISLNAPWIVGAMKGTPPSTYHALVKLARGQMPEIPLFAIPGGVNFMSVQSLTEATIAALTRGENGRGYLVGDENLYFKDLMAIVFRAVGRGNVEIPVRDEDFPLFHPAGLLAGRAGTIFYSPEGVSELGYRTHDIERTVRQIAEETA